MSVKQVIVAIPGRRVEPKHPKESFESMMRRWKKAVDNSEILKTLRERESYERPGETRKKARIAAVKREQRRRVELDAARSGRPPAKKRKDYHGNDDEG